MISIHAIYANCLFNRVAFGHTVNEAHVAYGAMMRDVPQPLYRVVVYPKHTLTHARNTWNY